MRIALFVICIFFVLGFVGMTALSTTEASKEDRVLFDSNRSGSFGIYSIGLDGKNLEVLIDSELHEMYPDVSPDGQLVAYAVGEQVEVTARNDVWIAERDGSNARLLVENATFPKFSADGSKVFFERDRRKVLSIPVDGGQAVELFPKGTPFEGRELAVPRVSPDERYIAVTVDYPQKWKTWVYDFHTKEHFMIGHGCEPVWEDDSKAFYWVVRGDFNSISAISRFDVEKRENKIVQDAGPPYGQEYFPSIASNKSILLWSACPVAEHSHYTSNYQVFWRKSDSEEVHQLTHDTSTNRWPTLLPGQ